jgi:uncharacterized surface protein with fasciclin (FAS1) repeats
MAAMTSRALVAMLVVATAIVAGCDRTAVPASVIESTAPPSSHVVQDLVGPGCDAYVRDHAAGAGSAAAIANQSAATAIASHPDLTEFAKAATGGLNASVDLTAELNAGAYTIFAPTDAAFAKLPRAALTALAAPDSAAALADLLRAHVVRGQHAPDDLTELTTVDDEPFTVSVKGDRIRVNGQANVTCGGLHTANATLYLIDGVLMPPTADASPSPTTDDRE